MAMLEGCARAHPRAPERGHPGLGRAGVQPPPPQRDRLQRRSSATLTAPMSGASARRATRCARLPHRGPPHPAPLRWHLLARRPPLRGAVTLPPSHAAHRALRALGSARGRSDRSAQRAVIARSIRSTRRPMPAARGALTHRSPRARRRRRPRPLPRAWRRCCAHSWPSTPPPACRRPTCP